MAVLEATAQEQGERAYICERKLSACDQLVSLQMHPEAHTASTPPLTMHGSRPPSQPRRCVWRRRMTILSPDFLHTLRTKPLKGQRNPMG